MGSSYTDIPVEIAKMLTYEPVPSTGLPVASVYGPITYLTNRLDDWHEVTNNLPAVYIDIEPSGIRYEQYDQGYLRIVPIMILLYIPIMTRGLPEADALLESAKADKDVKTAFSQLEEAMQSAAAMSMIGKHLVMMTGGIAYEPFTGGDEQTGVRVRVGMMLVEVTTAVR